jgi:plastocyanin
LSRIGKEFAMRKENQSSDLSSRRGFIKLITLAVVTSLGSPLLASCTAEREQEYEVDIVIQQNEISYSPAVLTIPRGSTITWLNKSYYSQSATCDPKKSGNGIAASLPENSEPWDSGVLYPGQRFSRRFDVPGTYIYFSLPRVSPSTVGTIVVK